MDKMVVKSALKDIGSIIQGYVNMLMIIVGISVKKVHAQTVIDCIS
jgi:hypothetical protein